jgi:hypothetical protein
LNPVKSAICALGENRKKKKKRKSFAQAKVRPKEDDLTTNLSFTDFIAL